MEEKVGKITVHQLFMELLVKFQKGELRVTDWDILMYLRRVEVPQEILTELAEFMIFHFFKDFEINDHDLGRTYLEQAALIVVDWQACEFLSEAIKDEKLTKREILNLTAIHILCLEIICQNERGKMKLLQEIVSFVLSEPPEFYVEDGYNECLRIIEKLEAVELIQTLVVPECLTPAEQIKWQEFQGYLSAIS
jgi:hypothetical protein